MFFIEYQGFPSFRSYCYIKWLDSFPSSLSLSTAPLVTNFERLVFTQSSVSFYSFSSVFLIEKLVRNSANAWSCFFADTKSILRIQACTASSVKCFQSSPRQLAANYLWYVRQAHMVGIIMLLCMFDITIISNILVSWSFANSKNNSVINITVKYVLFLYACWRMYVS